MSSQSSHWKSTARTNKEWEKKKHTHTIILENKKLHGLFFVPPPGCYNDRIAIPLSNQKCSFSLLLIAWEVNSSSLIFVNCPTKLISIYNEKKSLNKKKKNQKFKNQYVFLCSVITFSITKQKNEVSPKKGLSLPCSRGRVNGGGGLGRPVEVSGDRNVVDYAIIDEPVRVVRWRNLHFLLLLCKITVRLNSAEPRFVFFVLFDG